MFLLFLSVKLISIYLAIFNTTKIIIKSIKFILNLKFKLIQFTKRLFIAFQKNTRAIFQELSQQLKSVFPDEKLHVNNKPTI